jgi:ATP-dependent Clp protease ATP-binding subunit ClpX
MYELPSLDGVTGVLVDENVVNNTGKPLIIYENENENEKDTKRIASGE